MRFFLEMAGFVRGRNEKQEIYLVWPYRDLTGDKSASNDQRVCEVLEMEREEATTIFDLHEVKKTENRTKYQVFWEEAKKFLNAGIE